MSEENDKFDSYHYFLDYLDAKEEGGHIRSVMQSTINYEEVSKPRAHRLSGSLLHCREDCWISSI